MRRPLAIATCCALLIALGDEPAEARQAAGPKPGSAAAAPGDLVRRSKDAPSAPRSAPVVGEGAMLVSVPGYFVRSLSDPGLLVFRIAQRTLSAGRRPLFVMPGDVTDDVKAILDDPRPDSPSLFEVSGSVYEYRGRVFLLPVAAVALRNPPPPPMLARIAPREMVRPAPHAEGRTAPRIDAYANLEAAELDSTPVRDVPADRMAHEPNPANFPGLDDGLAEDLERRLDAGIRAAGMGTAIKRDQAKHDRRFLLPPATRLQERRATVLRDPITGAWRARLATGRAGDGYEDGSELSMELLPTRALERLERAVRGMPVGSTWLLSGEVVVAKDRNYLLLTRAVQAPASRFESP